jgi:hypothetical protein
VIDERPRGNGLVTSPRPAAVNGVLPILAAGRVYRVKRDASASSSSPLVIERRDGPASPPHARRDLGPVLDAEVYPDADEAKRASSSATRCRLLVHGAYRRSSGTIRGSPERAMKALRFGWQLLPHRQ